MNTRPKTHRFSIERRGGRGFGRLHETSGVTPPDFDFVKTRWGAGEYRIRRFDPDTSRWRAVDAFSVADDGNVTEAATDENSLREVVELIRAQTRQLATLQQRLERVEQDRRHPIEEVLQSLAYIDELKTRLSPRAANPPGDDGVLGNLAKGFGMMMQAAQGAPAPPMDSAPTTGGWVPFSAMDAAAPTPGARPHRLHPSYAHAQQRPAPQGHTPHGPQLRQPTLPGMTPDIERELVEYSQMLGIPWEAGISRARAQGWDAQQLLAFARGHVERMTKPKQEASHDAATR